MFNDPSSAAGISWEALKGALLLIKVHAQEHGIKTVHGEVSAVRADVIVLDDAGDVPAETVYADTLIFPKVIQSQTKGQVGSMVLGRLGQGQAKPAQSKPWTLAAATDADKEIGRAYLAKTQETPF